MVQDMTITAEGGPLGQVESKMNQQLNMTWDVQEVNDQGDAVVKQKLDHVKMKMTTPGGAFEYDSESEEAPAGLAAMIAPMYEAMTKGAFIVTMTNRGEIKDVKIPEEMLTALKNLPGAAAMGDMATAEGFKNLISQGALVLPEKAPQEGESWSNKVEMKNAMVGKQIVESTYRFEGTKEIDGETYAVIRPELKMEFADSPQPNMQLKVSEQSSGGEVLFNVEEGRLHSSKLTQDVTLEITAGGQPMKQKIKQEVDVTVAPTAEAESEAKSTESDQPAETEN
jgi:hypothetical protein